MYINKKKTLKDKRMTEHFSLYVLVKAANTVALQQTPPVTHLLLVLPPRASRSAASRGPARARWSARPRTGSSLNAVDREPASCLRPHMPGRWPTPPQASFSRAGLRLSADVTRADEPRSTARVCEGCTLCQRAGVKAGPAHLLGWNKRFSALWLVDVPLLYGPCLSPEGACAPSFLLISFSLLYYSLQSHMVRGLHHLLPKESFIVNSSIPLSCLIRRVIYGGTK